MEKAQLNFRAPLMSARRYSSPLRCSYEDQERVFSMVNQNSVSSQKTDLNSSEVVKPGSVPFMWEKIPGKAEGGKQLQRTSPVELPSSPKLPPGRTSRSGELIGFRNPNKLSGELAVLRPGHKLSGELTVIRSHNFSGELSTLMPNSKFAGEMNTLNKFYWLNDGMVRWGSSKEGTEMSATSESRDEGDDGRFSNDNDTFSQLGSFSFNCSISGLSESEQTNAKPCEMISTDRKSRDFMMDRFLPAARAMTLEPSQYASRKQLVNIEQLKEVKALVPGSKTPPPRQNMCNIVPYRGRDIGSETSEEDSYDEKSIISIKIKACGFLPQFFSKKSLCLLNRLPSMKQRSKCTLSAASKVSNLVKTSSWRSSGPKPSKPEPCNHHKRKQSQGFKSSELQKPHYTSRPMFYSGELQTRSGSPYRSSKRSSSSPHHSESPHCVHHTGLGFLTVPKQVNQNDHYRPKTPQKNRSVQVLKSETAFRYGGRPEIMRPRSASGPLVCGAVAANAPSKGPGAGNTDKLVGDDLVVVQSAFTPPLPKSPSESWLSRKLPSVSPRSSVSNSSLHLNLHSGKESAKGPASVAKWETIVKSSRSCHDHRWHSEVIRHNFNFSKAYKYLMWLNLY
ncbi:hypothetical protein Cgig2_030776 [Carnegiea gigantea]|uniref:Uncharacterized protein n=1 Tax=Carnegiea gigantea TaxID=171969 RepID=A0A9Q1QQS6_9CARY|nr:hypothetical protein Cgig2_030776 [Carnegiea gigantea]